MLESLLSNVFLVETPLLPKLEARVRASSGPPPPLPTGRRAHGSEPDSVSFRALTDKEKASLESLSEAFESGDALPLSIGDALT